MRSGPKPLPFQLAMASMASAGMAGGAAFDQDTLLAFFKGIQKYQGHPFKRKSDQLFVAWRMGQARLLRAEPATRLHKSPVILIPSMVNRSDILDLLPGRSLLRFLAAQGFDTYLFDWGQPVEDMDQADFESALTQRLIPAIESLGTPAFLLGYCMGGLFTAALSTLRPDLVKGAVLLATPWNFHDEKSYLRNRLTVMRPMAQPYMAQYGRLPDSWMQAVFATLDPESTIRKFAGFAAMAEDDPRAEMFVAVEDWVNEGIDLPAGIARTCMEDWYERNSPYLCDWSVLGETVVAANIRVPTMTIAARDDRIVPLESALGFAEQRVKGDRLIASTGHVGLIAGSKAEREVWTPIATWFAAQQ